MPFRPPKATGDPRQLDRLDEILGVQSQRVDRGELFTSPRPREPAEVFRLSADRVLPMVLSSRRRRNFSSMLAFAAAMSG